MARIRSIKPEFWDDRKLAKRASRDARLLYIGLWNLADEYGRLNGDPLWIKGKIFPYDDDIDVKAIVALLDELASPALGSVVLYEVDDDPYIFLPKLAKHQRLEPHKVGSRIPPPPGLQELLSEPDSDESVPRSERSQSGSDETEPGTGVSALFYVAGSMEHVGRAQRRASRIPDGFAPTDDMYRWAKINAPHVNAKRETDKFIDYWESKPGKDALKLDWAKTWKNWLRTAEERSPHSRAGPPGAPLLTSISPRDEHRRRR